MKKFHYLLLLTCLPFITSCNNDNNNESEEETQNQRSSLEAYANLNPDEPIIVDISNDKGESIVLMGTKTQTGHADKLQQMVITIPEEENPTEVFFDENEQVSDMIAPNGVRFKFDWISKDKVALTLVDPNTNEQLNTLIDLQRMMYRRKLRTHGVGTSHVVPEMRLCPLSLIQQSPLCLNYRLFHEVVEA